MTRNLYLGADIDRLMIAVTSAQAQGASLEEILVALGHATHAAREVVDRTDFTVRAPLLADEIARTRPDLVGLQEVALWRRGALDLDNVGVPDATDVELDHLDVLLGELATRGLDYAVVQVGSRADVEGPSFTGSPFDDTMAEASDVRLTMRDVILLRRDSALSVIDSGDRVFAHNLAVSIAGVEMRFDRGYGWVDVSGSEGTFRFVNTHLEAFSADIALAQAGELLAGAPATEGTTVLVGDFNSDPLDGSVLPGDHVPHRAAYELVTGSGFADEWLRRTPAHPGWTSGLSETVDDATAAGFDHRIDLVLVRTPDRAGVPVEDGVVTGTDPADRDPATGLWPSDHGGVVLRLQGL